MAEISDFNSDHKGRPTSPARITTSAGTTIYLLPVETFPNHINNLYLIDHPSGPVLFDAGTRKGRDELIARFEEIRDLFGVKTTLDDLSQVVISHAHIDHYGDAWHFRERGVPIAIHELDARVLARFKERLVMASRDYGVYLHRAGLEPEAVDQLIGLYQSGKHLFRPLEPDIRLKNGDVIGPGWPLLHVPGHCPGMICLKVDDVVLTADQLLSRITPAQSPHAITAYMGLENYLRSLEKLRAFGPFDLALGAHEAPMHDANARIDATIEHHVERLKRVYRILQDTPGTTADVAQALFGQQKHYGQLLALAEAGAHVEYLYDLGKLAIANLSEVAQDLQTAAIYEVADPQETV